MLELRDNSGKLQPESQVLVHRFLFVYPNYCQKKLKKLKNMIVSLIYVSFVSFLGKRRYGIAVRQCFSGEVPSTKKKTYFTSCCIVINCLRKREL